MRRFEPLLRRAWWGILSGRGEYEDFVQEVYLRLFARIRDLKQPAAFPGYLKSIVHSVAWDTVRKYRAHREGEMETLDLRTLQSRIDQEILAGIYVRSYLELLPPSERRVLALEYVVGASPDEIMREMGLTRGGISSAKSKGISKLRKVFASEL